MSGSHTHCLLMLSDTLPFFPPDADSQYAGLLEQVVRGPVSAGLAACMASSVAQGWDQQLCECCCRYFKAAKAGDLRFLQSKLPSKLQSSPLFGGWLSSWAARAGQLEALKWLRQQGICETTGLAAAIWSPLFPPWCSQAAAGGHLAVLQWLREKGCHWDEHTCAAAAGGGHLAVLEFAHQNGCPWGASACMAAAQHGNLSILKWLRHDGCPWWSSSRASSLTHRRKLSGSMLLCLLGPGHQSEAHGATWTGPRALGHPCA